MGAVRAVRAGGTAGGGGGEGTGGGGEGGGVRGWWEGLRRTDADDAVLLAEVVEVLLRAIVGHLRGACGEWGGSEQEGERAGPRQGAGREFGQLEAVCRGVAQQRGVVGGAPGARGCG